MSDQSVVLITDAIGYMDVHLKSVWIEWLKPLSEIYFEYFSG